MHLIEPIFIIIAKVERLILKNIGKTLKISRDAENSTVSESTIIRKGTAPITTQLVTDIESYIFLRNMGFLLRNTAACLKDKKAFAGFVIYLKGLKIGSLQLITTTRLDGFGDFCVPDVTRL